MKELACFSLPRVPQFLDLGLLNKMKSDFTLTSYVTNTYPPLLPPSSDLMKGKKKEEEGQIDVGDKKKRRKEEKKDEMDDGNLTTPRAHTVTLQ